MGHFGARPIRIAWFSLVLPTLLVNYFGQGAQLLADPETRVNPFFHLAPVWGAVPARRALDDGDGDRVAGDHLRRVLDDAAGDPARVLPAFRHPAHVGARNRAGLHTRNQLDADDRDRRARLRLPLVHEPCGRLRNGRHDDDGHHDAAGVCRRARVVAMEPVASRADHGGLPVARSRVLRRERAQDPARRLVPARRGGARLRRDVDLEARTRARRRAAARVGSVARHVLQAARGDPAGPCAGHRGVHDRPSRRRAADSRASPQAQQGAARAESCCSPFQC